MHQLGTRPIVSPNYKVIMTTHHCVTEFLFQYIVKKG